MIASRLVTALLLTCVCATPALASVKDGVEAWSRGDYAAAVAQWRGPAAQGDPDAQFNLAQAYKLGKGVPADLKRAEALYLQAAEKGHVQAADTYGLLLFQSGRRQAALAWLEPSAERGEPRAQYLLGIAHYNGDLVAKDPVRAYALMSRAAASGLEPARDTLAAMDRALPLDQRQQGVALAAQLEAKATQTRAAQLAALGLGDKGAPGKVAKPATGAGVSATGTVGAPLKSEPITAGADFAGPVTLGGAPAAKPVTQAAAKAEAAKSVAVPVKPGAAGAWRVQLGAFGIASNARALWSGLKTDAALAGRQAFFVPAGKLTKLQAGPFASRGEAQAACDRLAGKACMPVGN